MDNHITESVEQGERYGKFGISCHTLLTDYLGEHQSQVFYAHLLIDHIVTPMGPVPPIRVRIGQFIPVDLTNRWVKPNEDGNSDPCLVLAMPLYFFKRDENSRLGQSSALGERNTDVSCVNTADLSSSADSSPKRVPLNREKSDRNLISLVTVIVYFPVSQMSSANSLCVVGDQQKHVHLAPHPHEFVAYSSTITLPAEELGDRIVWGFRYAHTLIPGAMELTTSLLTAKELRREESQQLHGKERCITAKQDSSNGTSSSLGRDHPGEADPIFVVISRGVYNRLQVLRRIQMDGISLDQIQRPKDTVARPWYSKVLRTVPLTEEVRRATNGCEDPNSHELISFLNWSGLRVTANSEPPTHPSIHTINSSHGGYYAVFVRRQSLDCGKAIDAQLLTIQYPPAKFRRSRVRGTLHYGIKLKRRLAETNDLDGVIVKSNLVPPNLVQQTTGEDGISWCIVSPGQHKESVGWYTAFHSHSVDESRGSTSMLNSSIAARVKRIPCSERADNTKADSHFDKTIQTYISNLDDATADNLVDDVLMRPRNRVPPRRFDLTDADLEIALKRSLIEQTPARRKKAEIEVGESSDQNHHASDQGSFKEQPKKLENAKKTKKSDQTSYRRTFGDRQATTGINGCGYTVVDKMVPDIKVKDTEHKSPIVVTAENESFKMEPLPELPKLDVTRLPPSRQGKDQLSCTVVSRPKFIPKLKLTKRSNGKFQILHLSRKRPCPLKPIGKLHRAPSLSSTMDSTVRRRPEPTVVNDDDQTATSPCPKRNDCASLANPKLGVHCGPLNLSTHNRLLEPDNRALRKPVSANLSLESNCAHNLLDEQNGYFIPSSQEMEQRSTLLLSYDITDVHHQDANRAKSRDNDHLIPLTMWTKLKDPLPAPELHAETGSKTRIPTFPTTMISTYDLTAPSPTYTSSRLSHPIPFHYTDEKVTIQSEPSASTMYNQSSNDTLLDFRQPHTFDNIPTTVTLSQTQNFATCVSNPYALLTGVKRSIESTLLSATPGDICTSNPMHPFVQTINTTLTGLTLPVKSPVPYTIPQVTPPILCPNVIPTWSLIRTPCEPNRENFISPTNSWDMASVPPIGVPEIGKPNEISAMFFFQPQVPPQPLYGCYPTGPGWIQSHDVNGTWPAVQPLPPVQFIT